MPLGWDGLPGQPFNTLIIAANDRTPKPCLWSCGQFACGETGGFPWKTLRVSHRATLCPQPPQTIIRL